MSSLHGVNRASKLIMTTAACAALAVSATGCGEKEEPGTTGPVVTQSTNVTTTTTTTPQMQGSPSMTVDQFLTSPDAQKVCDELLTPAFLRKEYGGRKGCIAARKPAELAHPDPRLVVAKRKGSTLVVAKPRGGVYGGRTVRVVVLPQGSAFQINSVLTNTPGFSR
jgi:hypothetical protein